MLNYQFVCNKASREALLTRLLITSLLCLTNFDPFYKARTQSDYGYLKLSKQTFYAN